MLAVDLLLRWIHILSAVAMAGGAIFSRFPLAAARAELTPDVRDQFNKALRSKWSKWVMACSGLLLVSGLVNFILIVKRFQLPPTYHMLFGIKFLLALIIFALASLLTGRTAAADKLRQNERKWATVNILLAITVICIGGLLRFSDRQAKSPQSERTAKISTVQLLADGK